MGSVNSKQLERLRHYINTFKITYTDIAKCIGLDNSTVAKYIKGNTRMSMGRYFEILGVLKEMANGNELKIHLIDTWLLSKTDETEKKISSLADKLECISSELRRLQC